VLPGGVWLDDHREAPPLREVSLRAVGGEDEAFVLDSAGALPSERATTLLARCLLDGDRIAQALTIGDREALLLHLRRLTIGDAVDAVLRCPAGGCGEQMEIALAVSDLLLAPYRDVHRTYEVAVDVEGARYDVRFRLPTASDVGQAAVLAHRDPEQGATEILRRCVLRAATADAVMDVERLPAAVRSAVSAAMSERDPQAELDLALRCPSCGASFSALFDTATFFLRELEERAAKLLAEVHTLAWHYHWSEGEILSMPARRRAQYLALIAENQGRARAR
jgi:hypothetical protein